MGLSGRAGEERGEMEGPIGVTERLDEADREHKRMVEVLRYLAESCNHVSDHGPGVGDWDSHLHEPSTGGHRYCGPCVAWRVLNGSAITEGADR